MKRVLSVVLLMCVVALASNASAQIAGGNISGTVTDANGHYSFPVVTAGGDYTVTPSSTTSGIPPTEEATTAVPQAIASRFTIPSGS